jgi:hypothetical protein
MRLFQAKFVELSGVNRVKWVSEAKWLGTRYKNMPDHLCRKSRATAKKLVRHNNRME